MLLLSTVTKLLLLNSADPILRDLLRPLVFTARTQDEISTTPRVVLEGLQNMILHIVKNFIMNGILELLFDCQICMQFF